MKTQQILKIQTADPSLRADCDGWSYEDSACARMEILRRAEPKVHVGLLPSWDSHSGPLPHYKTVLHALADGWHLMSPPIKTDDKYLPYQWWLTR